MIKGDSIENKDTTVAQHVTLTKEFDEKGFEFDSRLQYLAQIDPSPDSRGIVHY
jgi:hypothetical protein